MANRRRIYRCSTLKEARDFVDALNKAQNKANLFVNLTVKKTPAGYIVTMS